MSGSRKNGRNGRNGRSAGKRMAKGSALMFSALGWHMPIFVSEGSRVWRLRNWYGLSKGEADSNEFTWGYEGDGPHATAYSMLFEAFGKDIAEKHAETICREFLKGWPSDSGFTVRGGWLLEAAGKSRREGKAEKEKR